MPWTRSLRSLPTGATATGSVRQNGVSTNELQEEVTRENLLSIGYDAVALNMSSKPSYRSLEDPAGFSEKRAGGRERANEGEWMERRLREARVNYFFFCKKDKNRSQVFSFHLFLLDQGPAERALKISGHRRRPVDRIGSFQPAIEPGSVSVNSSVSPLRKDKKRRARKGIAK